MKNQFISDGNISLQQFSLKIMTSMFKPITIQQNYSLILT